MIGGAAEESTMSRAIAVANNFIRRAQEHGVVDLSPAKLHDLVYLTHGWRIGSASELLFDTPVMAHHDGVFIKELREQGCWGTKRIETPIEVFVAGEDGMLKQGVPSLVAGDPALLTLDYVWDNYGRMTAFETTTVTREPGSPWDQVWNAADRVGDEAREIPQELIRQWFWTQFKLKAVAAVAKLGPRVRQDTDEHDEETELHLHPAADHLRSA
jgi:uncharacterized phage-associated protein